MKKNLITTILVIAALIIAGCVKDLEKEGVHSKTTYIGRVIEKSESAPMKGITVSVSDGTHVHASAITGDDGKFELEVDFDEINDSYKLHLDCQGYPSMTEVLKGIGQEEYNYKDIIFFDKSNTENWPTVTTMAASEITSTSAKCGGTITYSGAANITARGVCWGTTHNPSVEGLHSEDGSGTGSFTSLLEGLVVNTTYYVRAYAKNINGIYYGDERSFTTTDGAIAVTTNDVTNVTPTSASCGGSVTVAAGNTFPVTAKGLCWSTAHDPTIESPHTNDGSGAGNFTGSLTGLSVNTTYYVRAYATNELGTYYGDEKSFTTPDGLPVVVTLQVTDITPVSATGGGNVTSDSGFPVTERGICWSTFQNPTVGDNHKEAGTGLGQYSSGMTELSANKTYYVRAYATNANGTAYGENVEFTTISGLASVNTKPITSITPLTASGGGNVTSDNGFAITARGVCWSTLQNPTVSDAHTTNDTGTGEFVSALTELQPSTTYYVRAYATNERGTAYGEQKTFTTTSGAITVTTNSLTNIGSSSATCGGNATVTSDNNLPITAKGVCWSTGHNPTPDDDHTTDGSGAGTFVSSITGLTLNTTYYVRAYATNQLGTYYGTEKTFTTTNGLPSVTTTEPAINDTMVVSGGNVTNDGGFPVTSRGICYGSFPYPDLSDTYSHTSNGTGTGYYASTFELPHGSGTYYIRAYATNEVGTTYGEQKTVIQPYDTLPRFVFNGHVYAVAPTANNLYITNSAISYCDNLTLYGYSDWKLPTMEELLQMYENKDSIGGFLVDKPYLYNAIGNYVYGVNFATGLDCIVNGGGYVRPIRVEQ